jgi:hypothetical protein
VRRGLEFASFPLTPTLLPEERECARTALENSNVAVEAPIYLSVALGGFWFCVRSATICLSGAHHFTLLACTKSDPALARRDTTDFSESVPSG